MTSLLNSLKLKAGAARKGRRGYSIVEIGLVLIIIALLISAIIVAFYQLQTSSRQKTVTNMVNQVYSAVQDLHRSSNNYSNTNMVALMESAEVLPALGRKVVGGAVTLVTPFGNNVTVVGTNGGNTFTVTLANYSKSNCIAFMSDYVDRSIDNTGLAGVTSGANVMMAYDPGAVAAGGVALTVATVSSGCTSGDLALTFR